MSGGGLDLVQDAGTGTGRESGGVQGSGIMICCERIRVIKFIR